MRRFNRIFTVLVFIFLYIPMVVLAIASFNKGMDIAAHIYERHKVLTSVLIQLGVNPETAREDACKLEHDISDESFDALKRHLEKNNEQK